MLDSPLILRFPLIIYIYATDLFPLVSYFIDDVLRMGHVYKLLTTHYFAQFSSKHKSSGPDKTSPGHSLLSEGEETFS